MEGPEDETQAPVAPGEWSQDPRTFCELYISFSYIFCLAFFGPSVGSLVTAYG